MSAGGRAAIFVMAWVTVTLSAYAFVLTRNERGTGMGRLLVVAVATVGAAACLLNAIVILVGGAPGAIPLAFTAS